MNISDDFKSAINEKFTTKEQNILEKNKKFFSTNKKYITTMLKIIEGKSNISIRVLDWFVANYSKKNNTSYKINLNGKCLDFNVNIEYKNQLNAYSKQYFDPFCRKKKVVYGYRSTDGSEIINFISSIGQLNFFQWAIRNKIIWYVKRNLIKIEKDMKETSKLNKEKKLNSQSNTNKSDNINNEYNDEADPIICSSDRINSLHISPNRKNSNTKTDSDTRNKRQQLSKSVYDYGIKKSNAPIKLDFE
ncbi:hypothetical protein [Acanthamoeba polyphaga mimivirus]|uniref:Uncharacterized protein n=6 Tax=Megamimivirinae TaxID=3044648 RepID=A0A2L2DM18_MIMIV|nr:hypothetical protein MegaChil _gp0368 [Megavirus chiliensis]AEX61490.1 hypothetical protein c7_R426 [Megavirus courdo7]AFX92409.1 hypothetical protein CE11_00381 [Megavirus courdo11]AGD92275.1 hypothetical protein LBA_00356 [Megavirus lba]AUV58310.1 hypothetical protein [Bandra megavirus]AVG46098.1 hypothetical protein [Acanthamoeba polyphaga mimivirus]AVL93699.1 hypothetical protein mvi_339 [Megavirus vitis]